MAALCLPTQCSSRNSLRATLPSKFHPKGMRTVTFLCCDAVQRLCGAGMNLSPGSNHSLVCASRAPQLCGVKLRLIQMLGRSIEIWLRSESEASNYWLPPICKAISCRGVACSDKLGAAGACVSG